MFMYHGFSSKVEFKLESDNNKKDTSEAAQSDVPMDAYMSELWDKFSSQQLSLWECVEKHKSYIREKESGKIK